MEYIASRLTYCSWRVPITSPVGFTSNLLTDINYIATCYFSSQAQSVYEITLHYLTIDVMQMETIANILWEN